MIAHQESMTASTVLKIHTNRNGLVGPSQLTSEKLKILISTPTISMDRRLRVTTAFSQRKSFMLVRLQSVSAAAPMLIRNERIRLLPFSFLFRLLFRFLRRHGTGPLASGPLDLVVWHICPTAHHRPGQPAERGQHQEPDCQTADRLQLREVD